MKFLKFVTAVPQFVTNFPLLCVTVDFIEFNDI